jgi:hypothetical protein
MTETGTRALSHFAILQSEARLHEEARGSDAGARGSVARSRLRHGLVACGSRVVAWLG